MSVQSRTESLSEGFCLRCGNPLENRDVDGTARPACAACGWIFYQDPKVVVGLLLLMDEKLVLIKRAMNPGKGLWSFPAGFVERGEVLEEAASREAWEETGLVTKAKTLIGVYSRPGDPIILAVYEGEVLGGKLAPPGHEVQAVDTFHVNALPPMAFPRDHTILADWMRLIQAR